MLLLFSIIFMVYYSPSFRHTSARSLLMNWIPFNREKRSTGGTTECNTSTIPLDLCSWMNQFNHKKRSTTKCNNSTRILIPQQSLLCAGRYCSTERQRQYAPRFQTHSTERRRQYASRCQTQLGVIRYGTGRRLFLHRLSVCPISVWWVGGQASQSYTGSSRSVKGWDS